MSTSRKDAASTILLSSFLTGSADVHPKGSFALASRRMHKLPHKYLVSFVEAFLGTSPGFCHPSVTLHVVHDINTSLTSWRGVSFHRFQPNPARVRTDYRWSLYARILVRLMKRRI